MAAPRALRLPLRGGSEPLPWRRPDLALAVVGVGCGLTVGLAAAFGPAAGLASVLACAGGVALLTRPALGLLVLAGVVPVVAGLRRDLPFPGLRLSELLTVAVAAIVLVRLDGRTSPPWRALDRLALAYAVGHAGIGAWNLLSRGDAFGATNLGTLFGPFQFLLLYRAARALLVDAERNRLLLRLVLLASLAVSALAIAQAASVGPVADWITRVTGTDVAALAAVEARDFGRAEATLRATGPFPHWQVLAGYLFVVGLLAIALVLERSQRVLPQPWLVGVLVLASGAMVATGTFATTLCLLAAALALGAWAGQLRRVLVLLGGLAVVPAAFFTGTVVGRVEQQFGGGSLIPQSILYRIELWRSEYLPELAGRWILGYGPDLPPGVGFRFTESVYLTLLLRGGVVLVLLYAAFSVALLARAWVLRHHPDAEGRALARALVVLVVSLVVLHLVEPYFLTSGLPQLFWLLAAALMAVAPARSPG